MKKYPIFLFACMCISSANAQIITTIAGTGAAGYSGDSGPATIAKLNQPHGLSTDAIGNVFITDHTNNRLRQLKTSGYILTVAGTGTPTFSGDGGPATSAAIFQPFDCLTATDGNIYMADTWNNRVRKIDVAGIITTVAGMGAAGSSGDGGQATAATFSKPSGLAMDGFGNLYIADQYNHRVRKINGTTGIVTTIAGTGIMGYGGDGGPATAANLYYPNFLYVDAANNLYITDNGNHRVRKVNTSGIITTFIGTGIPGFSGDGGPATAAQVWFPAGMTMDPAGNTYLADYSNHRIRKITPAGIISTIAGTGVAGYAGDGGPALLAQFNRPTDVTFIPPGDLVICDHYNNRVRKIMFVALPAFTNGYSVLASNCTGITQSLDTMLSITDLSVGETETWSVVSSPSHGTLSGFPATATSTGGSVMPTGTGYTATTGYIGNDTFSIRVFDGTYGDTIKVYMHVDSTPFAGTLTGDSYTCVGFGYPLSASVSGGTWSSSGPAIATVSSSGYVTGVTAGTANISYTISSICGTAVTTRVVTVVACPVAVTSVAEDKTIKIIPNPSNGIFEVCREGGAPAQVAITDVTGRLIKQFALNVAGTERVELDVAPGVYMLTVHSGNSRETVRLMIR